MDDKEFKELKCRIIAAKYELQRLQALYRKQTGVKYGITLQNVAKMAGLNPVQEVKGE